MTEPIAEEHRRRYGQIELILGPMFSGKSTELLRRVRRYTIAKKKCIVIKHEADQRYSVERMATHDKQTWESVPVSKLSDLPQALIDEHELIGIDEGQFFPDVVEWCEKQANRHGKHIIVAALDGSYQRKLFGRILELIPCAESVVKLNAVCMKCGADAPFTARTSSEVALEVIGGADKYIAVCRGCHDIESELKTIPKIDTVFKPASAAPNAPVNTPASPMKKAAAAAPARASSAKNAPSTPPASPMKAAAAH